MSEQHNATAPQCLAMPKLYMSVPMLCHSTALLFSAVAPPFITLLFNAETQHSLALLKLSLSPPCPCSALLLNALAPHCPATAMLRSAFTLLIYANAGPCYSMPLPCPCTANPCFAVSVQRHLDTQLSHCRTSLINASAHPRLAYPCLCSTHLFVAMP